MDLLVTGGAGFIGSIVSSHLLAAGHTVCVLDNLERGHREAVPRDVELINADLRDADAVQNAFRRSYDAVLHFAAFALVAESVNDPGLYFHNNVGGTLNLLNAMLDSDTPRLVFSSTCAVYGESEQLPITETTAARPTNPYGASKLVADQLIGNFCTHSGIAAVSLRYFNVAGAHDHLGEVHEPETHLIPNVLKVALRKSHAVDIFGTDYPTRDGTAVRDYVHVDDVATAHMLALDHARPGDHQILNLGTGRGFSVGEVISTARTVTGREIPVTEQPRRPGDPASLVASPVKALKEIGWSPQTSSLEAMVSDAWSFAQSHPGGY